MRFRLAEPGDAEAVASLHADSWRRHYRGAYSDAFLDGDVLQDRVAVWTERLALADGATQTVLAEDDAGRLIGFAHTVFGDDPRWGALLDNLHVRSARKRQGLGSQLLELTARAVVEHGTGLYLWVLEQNLEAQAFYAARGAVQVERALTTPPGGGHRARMAWSERLNGTPAKLRYVWPDPAGLLS